MTIENLEHLVTTQAGTNIIAILVVPKLALSPGQYTLSFGIRPKAYKASYDYLPEAIKFEVISDLNSLQLGESPELGTRPESRWEYQKD